MTGQVEARKEQELPFANAAEKGADQLLKDLVNDVRAQWHTNTVNGKQNGPQIKEGADGKVTVIRDYSSAEAIVDRLMELDEFRNNPLALYQKISEAKEIHGRHDHGVAVGLDLVRRKKFAVTADYIPPAPATEPPAKVQTYEPVGARG